MNSSIEVSEAAKLAQKLIDRTLDGKLSWDQGLLTPANFTTVLEGNLRATVSYGMNGELRFSLVEFDPARMHLLPPGTTSDQSPNPDKDVLAISVDSDPAYGYATPEEKYLAGLLVDLHGLARRSALKVAGSVEKALSYLDRIAS